MIGHNALLAKRIAREKPRMTFINDGFSIKSKDWQIYDDYPCIHIEEKESLKCIDLRFICGLDVIILGMISLDRTKQLFDQCCKHSANKVVASFEQEVFTNF